MREANLFRFSRIFVFMSRKILLSILALLISSGSVFGQTTGNDPANDPRKVTPEPNNAIKKWINEEGDYLLTPDERRALLALKTDDEREAFIDYIWRRRDPHPDTEQNEFREEFYERIAYANENFASGKPGWKTDRGRIYIKWGKPDSVESRPSGGSYDRPAYHGGGSTTTYPFEVWFYRHLDGVGDGIEVEFVDPTGTGEYRIARHPDEKDALAMVPTENRLDPDRQFSRIQDTPFERLQTINAMERNPPLKNAGILDPLGQTTSAVIDNNPLDFDVRIDYFRQSDERVIAVFTIQADNRQLKFTSVGGIETATMNIVGRVTAVNGKRGGAFEDVLTTSATRDELVNLQARGSVYQKAVALAPGNYKVDIGLRDVVTGNKGVQSVGFAVPRYDDKKLSTSTLVIASKLQPKDPNNIGGQFHIGSAKVIPSVTSKFKAGQDVGLYMQVYNAETDQTTLRPAVDVEYQILREGKVIAKQIEDWSGLSDTGQRLVLARILPTSGFPDGIYEARIVIKDRVGNTSIESKAAFSIEN